MIGWHGINRVQAATAALALVGVLALGYAVVREASRVVAVYRVLVILTADDAEFLHALRIEAVNQARAKAAARQVRQAPPTLPAVAEPKP